MKLVKVNQEIVLWICNTYAGIRQVFDAGSEDMLT